MLPAVRPGDDMVESVFTDNSWFSHTLNYGEKHGDASFWAAT